MKNMSSNIAGIDALGRRVGADNAPDRRSGRYVGMFYFLWLGETGKHPPYNVSHITAKYKDAGYRPEVWGAEGVYHHWGEPFYGYYYSSDEWVIRKHIKLLMQADIDFLFFDTTNGPIYAENAMTVMKVLQEYHNEGFTVPKVMFYTNTASGKVTENIYNTIYKPRYCEDTWFTIDGKPVIIAIYEECTEECKNFFCFKKSQWPNEPDKVGGWPWMDFVRPQRVFKNDEGEDEVINVSVAQHPQIMFGDSVLYGETANRGRAFHNGENDKEPDAYIKGYNFKEQFDRAIEADPPYVLVTGWNEWIAGRWRGTPSRPIRFVDCCNYEYSRDIEMMRGGYFDNYFMQLADHVRRYKGTEKTPVTEKNTPAVFSNVTDGDMRRDCDGYGAHYTSDTEKNAITSLSVVYGDGDISFTVTAKDSLKFGEGDDMAVFVKTAEKSFVISENGLYSLSSDMERSYIKDVRADISDKAAQYTVDRSDLGICGDFELNIKAADATVRYTSVEDFYDKGDVFPLGRLGISFKGTK